MQRSLFSPPSWRFHSSTNFHNLFRVTACWRPRRKWTRDGLWCSAAWSKSVCFVCKDCGSNLDFARLISGSQQGWRRSGTQMKNLFMLPPYFSFPCLNQSHLLLNRINASHAGWAFFVFFCVEELCVGVWKNMLLCGTASLWGKKEEIEKYKHTLTGGSDMDTTIRALQSGTKSKSQLQLQRCKRRVQKK